MRGISRVRHRSRPGRRAQTAPRGRPGRARGHDRILQEARRLARVRHCTWCRYRRGAARRSRRALDGARRRGIARSDREARGMFGAREGSVIGQALCSALASSTPPACCTATSKRRTSCAKRADASSSWTSALARSWSAIAGQHGSSVRRCISRPDSRREVAWIRSNLYSVGVLLFYLVTERTPGLRIQHRAAGRCAPAASAPSFARRMSGHAVFVVQVIDRALEHEPAADSRARGNGGCASG